MIDTKHIPLIVHYCYFLNPLRKCHCPLHWVQCTVYTGRFLVCIDRRLLGIQMHFLIKSLYLSDRHLINHTPVTNDNSFRY